MFIIVSDKLIYTTTKQRSCKIELQKVILSKIMGWVKNNFYINCVWPIACPLLPQRTGSLFCISLRFLILPCFSSPITQMNFGWLTCMRVCEIIQCPQRGSHRESVKGTLACQPDSSHGEEPHWQFRLSACAFGLVIARPNPQAPFGNSHTKKFSSGLFALPQVGVCDEERLPGEGGGHPVISHHKVKRCHADQQLWDWASPVEPWGLCHTSKCEPGYLF